MKISPNLSYSEVIRSQYAIRNNIDNIPNEWQLENLEILAQNVFQPLRDWYNKPIFVSSGFRSFRLNKRLGGATNPISQHCKGQALDLDTDEDNAVLFHYIKDNLIFDQLIWEFGDYENPAWVHVSFNKENNRGEVLKAVKVRGKTKYLHYE